METDSPGMEGEVEQQENITKVSNSLDTDEMSHHKLASSMHKVVCTDKNQMINSLDPDQMPRPKGLAISTNMIFSQVLATIAIDLLEYFPGDKELFLRSLVPADVGVHHNNETGALCLYGMFDEIVKCQEKLVQFLRSNSAISHVDSLLAEKESKMYVDVGVECDIQNCSNNQSSDPNDEIETGGVAAVQDMGSQGGVITNTKSDIAEVDNDEEILENDSTKTEDICEIKKETTGNKIIKSRKGRLIKRPYKLANAAEGDDKLEDELVENDPEVPEKKHRRYFRAGRRHGKVRFKSTEKISVEAVRRQVQEEKMKEEREKGNTETGACKTPGVIEAGVLQNIFMNSVSDLTDLQVQEAHKNTVKLYSEMKASDSLKRSKRHYEDKMPFKFFCDKCSFKSKRESHYQHHMDLHKKNPNMELFKCDECNFVGIRQSVLNRHLLIHKDVVLSCVICPYKTGNQKQLECHKRKHKKQMLSRIPGLQCNTCNFTTLSKTKLMAHMEERHMATMQQHKAEGGEQVYKCDLCLYKSKRKEHLIRHQANVHSDNRPFLCDLCGAAFKRVDALASHKITHLDRSKRKLPYLCLHCKKAFKSQAHLKEHLAVHTTVRSFQCHICGQMFKTRSVQRRHQQNIHFNPRSHKCTHCNKDFNTKYAFQRHLRIHDNEPADHPPTQIQPQMAVDKQTVEQTEQEDENISAIQTITIAPENLNEFTQQLQNVSDQIQTTSDIGEIYIQGLEGIEMETINIVNVPGQEVRQIYVPSDTDPNTILTSSDQVRHIYISSKSDDNSNEQGSNKKTDSVAQSDFVKQILLASDAGNLNVSGLKELYVKSQDGAETVQHILIPTMENTGGTEGGDFTDQDGIVSAIEGVGSETLMVQNIENQDGTDSGTVKASVGGQTYEIKLVENGPALLTLGSTAVQNL